MKHLILTLATCMILCMVLSAQSFNYETLNLKYRLAPKTPFTTEFKTITVRFHGEEYLKKYGILSSDLTSGYFKFSRFENVAEKGDLHLDVFVGRPEYLGVEKETEVKKENEKDVTYHYYRGAVITPISYTLRDGARDVIEEEIVYTASDHLYFGTERHPTSSALSKYWDESQNIVVTKMITTILDKSLVSTAVGIRSKYDDNLIEDSFTFFDIKKADKINAEFLNTAFTKITSALSKNPIVSDWDESTKTEITNLLMKGTKMSYQDKDQRIAYAIAHYNLALLHLFWNDAEAAKTHITKGLKAGKKNWEFEQVQKLAETMGRRGEPNEISSKSYTGTYQEGADNKLPGLDAGATSEGVVTDLSGKERSVDTVYVKNGDKIVGYVNAVHKMRKVGQDEIHDFTHLVINPLNMPQKEVNVSFEEIVYLRHKDTYLIPLPTKIATSLNPPMHLYEPVKISNDQKLGLMRTGYHESMPYTLSAVDMRAYLYTYKPDSGSEEFEILPITGGARYALGLNGALAKDFQFCPAIVAKAKDKGYSMEEASLAELVEDYNRCAK